MSHSSLRCSLDATRFLGKVDVAVVHRKSTALAPLHEELLDGMASISSRLKAS